MTDTIDQTRFDLTPPTDEQFQALTADLGDEERKVLLEHGTEAPFCGVFLDEKREGVFTCRLCGLPLFAGGTKFESGTGWPSFTQPFAEGHLKTIQDSSYGMVRTEIVCARCGGTRAMCSPTARRQPASDTASTACRWGSHQRARRCPTGWIAARRKVSPGRPERVNNSPRDDKGLGLIHTPPSVFRGED